jgi:putative tryptophan/tyrosine transport system substrate-binding protein
MRRREVMAVLAGAAALPLAARAQQPAIPIVGFLNSASADNYGSMAAAFRDGLAEVGYHEGNNVAIEHRWADNEYERLPALAAELVERRMAVIFANSPSISPVKAATSTVPIVFLSGDDPVRLGLVASLSRPGGNVTGVAILSRELAGKRLALLHELVPHARTIAVLINSDFEPSGRFQVEVQAAAGALGLAVQFMQANTDAQINVSFSSLAQAQAGALLVGPGPFLDSRRKLLVALAANIAIPAGYETRATAAAGGLMSYGASVADGYRQAGVYAGRILKGEKPADLPVLLPTKVELVINLDTAKTLNLAIPPTLLARADEVIE